MLRNYNYSLRLACKLLGFFLCFLVIGCASYRWTKPGGTQQEFARDNYQCQVQAQQVVPYRSELVPISNPNGTTSYATQDGNRYARSQLAEQCLQSRGWQQVRVN